MTKIGVQLHTFREIPEDLPTILHRVAEHGFEGVEFAHRIHGENLEAVSAALGNTGLTPIGAHVSLSRLEANLETLIDRYEAIDCSSLVIPHIPTTQFIPSRRIDTLAGRLADLAAQLHAHGMELVIHNTKAMHAPAVNHNVFNRLIDSSIVTPHAWATLANSLHPHLPQRWQGETVFEHLIEATRSSDIKFEIDVEHAVGVGRSPSQIFHTVGDRLFAVHISDGVLRRRFPRAYRSTPLGDGYIDLDGEIRAALQHDAKWLIGEVDDPPRPGQAFGSIMEAIETSYQRVQSAQRIES